MIKCWLLGMTTLAAVAGKSVLTDGRNFLGNGMQPEMVARTLSDVQNKWQDEATQFIRCELSESNANAIKDCDSVPEKFSKSCATVVDAVVAGSGGDARVTKEYMVDVCSQPSLTAWRRDACVDLARDLTKTMSASTYENRFNLRSKAVCDEFWSNFLQSQKVVHEKEVKAIENEQVEREKRAAEAVAKQAQKEKEEAEKHRKEKSEKVVAEKRQKEEEAKKMEAEMKAEKEAELEDARQKLKLDEQRRNSKDATIAKLQAVDEAAEQKIKEATQVEEGTEDTRKAYDVLKLADAAEMPEPKIDALATNASKEQVSRKRDM